jgi:hypothetical protein
MFLNPCVDVGRACLYPSTLTAQWRSFEVQNIANGIPSLATILEIILGRLSDSLFLKKSVKVGYLEESRN